MSEFTTDETRMRDCLYRIEELLEQVLEAVSRKAEKVVFAGEPIPIETQKAARSHHGPIKFEWRRDEAKDRYWCSFGDDLQVHADREGWRLWWGEWLLAIERYPSSKVSKCRFEEWFPLLVEAFMDIPRGAKKETE